MVGCFLPGRWKRGKKKKVQHFKVIAASSQNAIERKALVVGNTKRGYRLTTKVLCSVEKAEFDTLKFVAARGGKQK